MDIKRMIFNQIKEKHTNEINVVSIGLFSSFVGLMIEYANFQLFLENEQTFAMLSLVAVLVGIVPPLYIKYTIYNRVKSMESAFPTFLSDITSNIKAGMTLPQAIRSLNIGHYGALSPYVKEIAAKISWGIPFDKVLIDFANKTNSPGMKRTIGSIIEAHKSGGTMNTVLLAVSESLYELEKIKKERTASVYSQMLNGYMIFFIFLGVMIGMSRFLLPTFNFSDGSLDFAQNLPVIFRNIVLIQGIFAGLTIGKMSEGRLIAGVKHAMVLAVIGFSAIVLAL